ncbi:MAG: AraC family transcriptional regulator [Chloroflexi bacterium]|nr:AraC family transcriptional regulator [Chloroflexota bacterium]
MSNLESVYQAVQFIEQHLKAPISIQDVADAVGYSVYHFSRTFNRVIGHSPYDYIMRRRLSESARELVESGKRIIDVAFEYQFNNPETYSRAFRRMFGMLPNQVKKSKILPQLVKLEATLEYIKHINKGDYLKPELVELDKIHLVGLASRVKGETDIVTELWEQLSSEIESIPKQLKPQQYYGVSFFTLAGDPQSIFFMIGVAVDSLDAIPPTLVGKTIQPLKYAKFIHKGPSKDVGMTLDYVYQTWLPKSDHSTAAPLQIEFYGERYKGPDDPDSESEILIPIDEIERASKIPALAVKSQAHDKQ